MVGRRIFLLVMCVVPCLVLLYVMGAVFWTTTRVAITAEWEENILWVKGDVSLPDQALIAIEIAPFTTKEVLATGIAVVSSKHFSQQFAAKDLPEGDLEVVVRFAVHPDGLPQPPHVVKRYGAKGERISGEFVRQKGSSKWLEWVQKVPAYQSTIKPGLNKNNN